MAKKKKARRTQQKADPAKGQLIVSDDQNPAIALKPGMKFEVVTVSVKEGERLKPSKTAARLCGGTSTCLALIAVE